MTNSTQSSSRPRTFVGITGASGHLYAETLLRELVRAGRGVDVSITDAGCKVLRHERGVEAGVEGEKLQENLASWLGPEIAEHIKVYGS
ncbi:MAG: flavoprotein, partial [Planctomycetota bacterium]